MLLGLIHEGEGLAADVLQSLGISLEAVRREVGETVGPAGTSVAGSPPFTPRAKKVLELSLREALQLGHNYIGTEHMLLGLVREGEGVGAQVLVKLGAELSQVRQQLIQLLSGHPEPAVELDEDEDIELVDVPVDPGVLLTAEEAEEVLRNAPIVETDQEPLRHSTGRVEYVTRTYRARPRPTISVAVAGARVSREAFDRKTDKMGKGLAVPVDNVGDAATFDPSANSIRVLKGETMFTITVRSHAESLSVATALARRAADRISIADDNKDHRSE
jgi:hypothetical protein